jgi:hypothetical protein
VCSSFHPNDFAYSPESLPPPPHPPSPPPKPPFYSMKSKGFNQSTFDLIDMQLTAPNPWNDEGFGRAEEQVGSALVPPNSSPRGDSPRGTLS